MLGTTSMVVIIILFLANFAFLCALPACTKTCQHFPCTLSFKPTSTLLGETGCKMNEINNLFDIDWDLTPETACDNSPGVQRILTTGRE